jgi:SPP1 family predicted phage head-tail adaptor
MKLKSRISAGDLRQQIKIVDLTNVQDSFGGVAIDSATPFATVWAAVEPLSGRELYTAQQKVSEVTHRITIRWMEGVKARQNVWFNDRQFQIEAVENPEERNIVLYLLCIELDDSAREQGGGVT